MEINRLQSQQDDTHTQLHQASQAGCVESLMDLLQKDPLIINKVSLTPYRETPLHVSASLGHLEFTKTLLARNRKLAEELDTLRRSALHLAAAEGHNEIVSVLLNAYYGACLSHDEDGRIPLHYAAMRGRLEVLKQLIQAKPESIYVKVQNGSRETVLHLCVAYNQLECLKLLVQFLVEKMPENTDFLNSRSCGMTILHLALMLKRVETIRYLLPIPVIKAEANSVNGMAVSMLDVVKQSPIELKSLEIQQILMDAGIKRGDNNHDNEQPIVLSPIKALKKVLKASLCTKVKNSLKYKGDWLEDIRGNLMVVAAMISTMTFQAAISPPGGVLQENVTAGNSTLCSQQNGCFAGTAVLAYADTQYLFTKFLLSNTISFFFSLSVIFLLVSGFPLTNRLCLWLLSASMWVTLTFTFLAFTAAIHLVTPDHLEDSSIAYGINLCTLIWMSLYAVVIFWNTIRFLIWLVKKLFRMYKRVMKMVCLKEPRDHPQENRISGTV